MIKVKAEFPILRVVCPTTIVKRIMVVEEMPKVKKFIKRDDPKDSKRVVYIRNMDVWPSCFGIWKDIHCDIWKAMLHPKRTLCIRWCMTKRDHNRTKIHQLLGYKVSHLLLVATSTETLLTSPGNKFETGTNQIISNNILFLSVWYRSTHLSFLETSTDMITYKSWKLFGIQHEKISSFLILQAWLTKNHTFFVQKEKLHFPGNEQHRSKWHRRCTSKSFCILQNQKQKEKKKVKTILYRCRKLDMGVPETSTRGSCRNR